MRINFLIELCIISFLCVSIPYFRHSSSIGKLSAKQNGDCYRLIVDEGAAAVD